MSGAETDLFDGLAQLLDDAGIGLYHSSGAYAASDQWAITDAVIPSSPATVICLATFAVQDDAKLNDSVIGVRVNLRGTQDPRSVTDKQADIFNVFQGLEDRDFGSMHLALMWRQSGQLNGQDDQQRWTSYASYYSRCNVPTLYRTE